MTGGAKRAKKSALGAPKTRAPYTSHVCDFCRGRKIKCNGLRPSCSSCDRSGNECNYSTKRAHTARRLEDLEKRIDTLDGQVDTLTLKLAQCQEALAASRLHPPSPSSIPVPSSSSAIVDQRTLINGNNVKGIVENIMHMVQHQVELQMAHSHRATFERNALFSPTAGTTTSCQMLSASPILQAAPAPVNNGISHPSSSHGQMMPPHHSLHYSSASGDPEFVNQRFPDESGNVFHRRFTNEMESDRTAFVQLFGPMPTEAGDVLQHPGALSSAQVPEHHARATFPMMDESTTHHQLWERQSFN